MEAEEEKKAEADSDEDDDEDLPEVPGERERVVRPVPPMAIENAFSLTDGDFDDKDDDSD